MPKLYTPEQISIITKHYLEALLWTAPENDSEENPGDCINVNDLPPNIWFDAQQDCIEFVESCGELFTQAMGCYDAGYGRHPEAGSAEAAFGHDFALTRNGHGCGFWDRESEGLLKELGDKLTVLCQQQEKNLFVSEDGSVYYE